MSVFLLPLDITRDIEKALSRYWWNSSQDGKSKIHWLSWDRLSRHKSTGGMGFRNFRDFNLAMLGKQGWKFLTNPNSLVSKVYKARYFAKGDFLGSNLGNNPSFIWRSIWEAKEVVRLGIRWRIGTGSTINIIDQPWLVDDANPYITSESEVLKDNKVISLLKNDVREWDQDLIWDMFNVRDQNCIFQVPLDDQVEEDTIVWMYENTGVYSVKSAYNMIQRQKGLYSREDSSSIWSQMWKVKAPPKTLNLIWRALSMCLPTKFQLFQKHVQIDTRCPVCLNGEESIIHSLVSCAQAVQCWKLVLPTYSEPLEQDFHSWLVRMFNIYSHKLIPEIITVCWAIWQARNNLVWNQKSSNVNGIVASAKQYLLQWRQTQTLSTAALFQTLREGDGASSWVRPQENTIKVTVDAALFADRSEYGFALIARDLAGQLIEAVIKCFPGTNTAEFAEAMAVKEALSWIKQKQWNNVELESDCLAVVQAIRSKVHMRSGFGQVIEFCRREIGILNKVSLYFVKRSANMVAHQFARASYKFPYRVFNRYNLPIELKDCILSELVAK